MQLRDRLRQRRNRKDFQRAKHDADQNGGRLCGTFADNGQPLYFVVPADATDDAIEAEAFKVKNGRSITGGELMLIRQARDRMAQA